jgi:beta-galactosidase
VSGQKFSFGATRFDIHEVTKTTHRKDLTQMDHTDLYIDYRMSGVGSHSCGGQDPVPDCRINADEQFDFYFLLEPLR